MTDRINVQGATDAGVIRVASAQEHAHAEGVYNAQCWRPEAEYVQRVIEIRNKLATFSGLPSWIPLANARVKQLQDELEAIPHYLVWEEPLYHNTVMTAGKNDMLDKYLAGSAYTAAFYMGLISSVSYSAIAAADTMSSHAGWTEAGIANAPTYSQAARPTAAWASATGGSKALSASLTFSITGSGTVKGSFLATNSTKDGTTGILFSAGLFTGGDKILASSDSLSVSYSLSI